MDIFYKLFPTRKKYDQNIAPKSSHRIADSGTENATNSTVSIDDSSYLNAAFKKSRILHTGPCEIKRENIRILLYRECDRRGRKLLYDSRTVVCVPIADTSSSSKTFFRSSSSLSTSSSGNLSSSPLSKTQSSHKAPSVGTKSDSFAEVNDGYGYQYLTKSSDTKQIGELVFGTVALAYKGSSSKLHILQEPTCLLLSRTSPAPRSKQSFYTSSDPGIEDSFNSSLGSISDLVMTRVESLESTKIHPSWPVAMPQILSSCNSEDDSGFGGPPSPFSSTCGSFLSPPSLPNTPFGTPSSRSGSGNSLNNSGSLNSLQRRFLRNVNTSLDALVSKSTENDLIEGTNLNFLSSNKQSTKLGLAIAIDFGNVAKEEDLKEWFFAKQPIIEGIINKLKYALDYSYLHSQTFVSSTHKAVNQFQKDIIDLLIGPRLPNPMWLSMLSGMSSKEQNTMSFYLVNTLAKVLSLYDTKQTNFFVSKLLTATLTYHLGWVTTVAPGVESNLKNPKQGSFQGSMAISDVTEVEELNKKRPYCAIWGQLCELHGAVGYPLRTARTILVGQDTELLESLLVILSYVIRCSQVFEHKVKPFDFNDIEEINQSTSDMEASSASINRISSAPSTLASNSSRASISTTLDTSLNNPKSNRRNSQKNQDNSSSVNVKSSNNRETETVSRWMLNDDVEIVIGEDCRSNYTIEKSSEVTLHDSSPDSLNTISPVINTKPCALKSSKTKSNLLDWDQSALETSSSNQLYPNLCDMDDHKETFGLISLEPNVIDEKVKRLFRVPNNNGCDNNSDLMDPNLTIDSNEVSFKNKTDESAFKSSNFDCFKISGMNIHPEIEDGSNLLVLDSIDMNISGGGLSAQKHSNSPINYDTCDMSNVDFTINNDELDMCNRTLCNDANSCDKTIDKYNRDIVNEIKKSSSFHIQSDRSAVSNYKRASSDSPKLYQVKSITHSDVPNITTCDAPSDNLRKMVKQRYVGRESNLDLTTVEKIGFQYPTVGDLKSKKNKPINRTFDRIRSHKRNKSDPVDFTSNICTLNENISVCSDNFNDSKLHENETKIQNTSEKSKDNSSLPEFSDRENPFNLSSVKSVSMPRCQLEEERNSSTGKQLAESLLGGIFDTYSSVFTVHATTDTSKWEERLHQDLFVDAHYPILDPNTSEAVAIVANIDLWDVEIVSSHSIVVEKCDLGRGSRCGGQQIGMSPLIASITDSLVNLSKLGAPPHFILQTFEDRLRELYIKSHLLAEYLLSSVNNAFSSSSNKSTTSPFNLNELTRVLSLDINDLPLLLAVASTHTPALTHMFGISVR